MFKMRLLGVDSSKRIKWNIERKQNKNKQTKHIGIIRVWNKILRLCPIDIVQFEFTLLRLNFPCLTRLLKLVVVLNYVKLDERLKITEKVIFLTMLLSSLAVIQDFRQNFGKSLSTYLQRRGTFILVTPIGQSLFRHLSSRKKSR